MLTQGAWAQERRVVTGTVTEANGAAIGGVVVKALDSNGKIIAFATTDSKGTYRLKIPAAAKVAKVNFAAMGYEAVDTQLADSATSLDAKLGAAPTVLPEVKAEVKPIRTKGDTIKYSVDAFKSSTDRNIEDVIKKLPGVSVGGDGSINYQGRPITAFYIEGLDMLKGRYALATRNISPEDVATVDVYEHHQRLRMLDGVLPSEDAALNLTLKSRGLHRPIGYASGGAGADLEGDALWKGELFGMMIGSGVQMMTTAKGNNAGTSYENETKSKIGDPAESTIADNLWSPRPFGSAPLTDERYADNTSASATVNTIRKIGQFNTASAGIAFGHEARRFYNSEDIDYGGVDAQLQDFYQQTANRLRTNSLAANVNYFNNARTQSLQEDFSLKADFTENSYGIASSDADLRQRNRVNCYSVANSISAMARRGMHIWNLSSKISFSQTPVARMGVDPEGDATYGQEMRASHFHTAERASSSWFIGGDFSLGLVMEFDADWQKFSSDPDGTPPTPAPGNDAQGYKIALTATPTLLWQPQNIGNFSLDVPLRQLFMGYKSEIEKLLPATQRFDAGVSLRYSRIFSPYLSANANIRLNKNYGSLQDFLINPVYITWRTLNAPGAGLLSATRTRSAGVGISWKRPQSAFFAYLNASYTHNDFNSIAASSVVGDELISSRIGGKSTRSMTMADATVSKRISSLRTTATLSASVQFTNSSMLRQEVPMKFNTALYSIFASLRSNPCRWLDFDLSGSYSDISMKTDPGIASRLPSASVSLRSSVIPCRDLEFWVRPDFTGRQTTDAGFRRDFFLDAGCRTRVGKVELELQARNLTDRRTLSYSVFSAIDTYTYSFRLRPLELLLSAKINF